MEEKVIYAMYDDDDVLKIEESRFKDMLENDQALPEPEDEGEGNPPEKRRTVARNPRTDGLEQGTCSEKVHKASAQRRKKADGGGGGGGGKPGDEGGEAAANTRQKKRASSAR